jgi:hypothetical protein
MQRVVWLSVLIASLAPFRLRAEDLSSTAGDRTSLSLTIFSDGRGQVCDERTVLLPSGEAALRFTDIPSQIDPTSVRVVVREGRPVSVVEQSYAYDPLTPATLLEKGLGQTLTLVRRGQADGDVAEEVSGRLLSAAGGTVWELDGRIVTNPQTDTVVFPALPAGLVTQPTLIWTMNAADGGRRRIEASYLVEGMSWRADYTLSLDAAETSASLEGWATIDNATSGDFEDARIQLVAGRLRTVPAGLSPIEARARPTMGQHPLAAPDDGPFECHDYTLPRRTTLRAGQKKQTRLLEAASFPVHEEYLLRGNGHYLREPFNRAEPAQRVAVLLRLGSGEKGGLDIPLPAGIVRVYRRDRLGGSRLVGEDWIDHASANENLHVRVGDASDITAEHRQLDFESISPSVYESAHEVRIRNRRDAAVVVRVSEPVEGDWMVVESSHPVQKGEGTEIEFLVPVPAGEETILTYRVRLQ